MDHFFSWVTAPYTYNLGDFAIPLVWGILTGLLYIKTGNSMLTVIVGLTLMTGLISSSSYLNTSTQQIYFWAIVLAALSFACSMFYLIKVRVVNPI